MVNPEITLSFQQTKEFVTERIGSKSYERFLAYVKEKDPNLWGLVRPSNFIECMVLAFLYKDLTAKGYQLVSTILSFGFHINHKSLEHNVKAIRRLGGSWGDKQIVFGRLRDWIEAADNTHQSKEFGIVHLWADSSDFPLCKSKGINTLHEDWSFKENSPAQRWMVFSDAKGRIRRVWGGFSPKLYDSHWLALKKRSLEKKLKGATVIADQHFRSGSSEMRNFTILTQHPSPSKKKGKTRGSGVAKLTKRQQNWNSAHKKIRSRVESPFGIVKGRFEALKKRWAGSKNQQSYLVLFAFGVHNVIVQNCKAKGHAGAMGAKK